MQKIPILIELNNISMLRKKLDNRVKRRTNHDNLAHNSDTGTCGDNPCLAAQPVVGVCTRRRGRSGSGYPFDPALIGQNLINF